MCIRDSARTGKMFDDCLTRATRLAAIDDSLASSDLGTDEQRVCAADKFDTLVADNGGYVKVLTDEVDISNETLALFDECGIDLFAAATDSGGDSACDTERRTVETAIEAYFAANGTDATSYDDLVPDYLVEDPSERFEFVLDTSGVPYIVGVGECEGY